MEEKENERSKSKETSQERNDKEELYNGEKSSPKATANTKNTRNTKKENETMKYSIRHIEGGGYFTSIRMDAMSKHAFWSFLVFLTLFFLIFCIITSKHAPSSYTTEHRQLSYCPNGFTIDHVQKCQSSMETFSTWFHTGIFDNSQNHNQSISLQLSQADSTNTEKMYMCLFDECKKDESKNILRNITTPTLQSISSFHFAINISSIHTINRYFILSLQIPYVNASSKLLTLYTTTSMSVTSSKLVTTKLNISSTLLCQQSSGLCDDVLLYNVPMIDSSSYFINAYVNLSTTLNFSSISSASILSLSSAPVTNPSLAPSSSAPSVDFYYGTKSFSTWLFEFKLGFFLISGLLFLYFVYVFTNLPATEKCIHHYYLLIMNFLLCYYDDPFYGLTLKSASSIKPVSTMTRFFQALLYTFLFFYFLIQIHQIVIKVKEIEMTNRNFYKNKILFVMVLVILLLVLFLSGETEVEIVLNSIGFLQSNTANSLLLLLFILFAIIGCYLYFCYLFYQLLSYRYLINYRDRFFLLFTNVFLILSIIALSTGGYTVTPYHLESWTCFNFLYNLYIWTITFLYSPLPPSTEIKNEERIEQMIALSPHSKRVQQVENELKDLESNDNGMDRDEENEDDDEEIIFNVGGKNVA